MYELSLQSYPIQEIWGRDLADISCCLQEIQGNFWSDESMAALRYLKSQYGHDLFSNLSISEVNKGELTFAFGSCVTLDELGRFSTFNIDVTPDFRICISPETVPVFPKYQSGIRDFEPIFDGHIQPLRVPTSPGLVHLYFLPEDVIGEIAHRDISYLLQAAMDHNAKYGRLNKTLDAENPNIERRILTHGNTGVN